MSWRLLRKMKENKREIICRVLCGKEKCHLELSACDGKQNSRCKQLGKSFILNMNAGQIDYVTSQLWKKHFSKGVSGKWKNGSFGNKSGI